MPRNNILLRRFPAPKWVQLPNGRVFFAKYQRVGRHALTLTYVRTARTYVRKFGARRQRITKIGPRNRQRRRQQASTGFDLSTTLDLGRKAVRSKLNKMMINDAIDYIPTAYKKVNQNNQQKVKAVMNTGVDDCLVNREVELIGERFN